MRLELTIWGIRIERSEDPKILTAAIDLSLADRTKISRKDHAFACLDLYTPGDSHDGALVVVTDVVGQRTHFGFTGTNRGAERAKVIRDATGQEPEKLTILLDSRPESG